jgi:hypothetical protein
MGRPACSRRHGISSKPAPRASGCGTH